MAEHTPTPWDFEITDNTYGWKPSAPTVTILAGDVLIATYVTDYVEFPATDEESAANAAFIVKACNAHEALVAENERLRSALKPFVVLANTVFEKYETGPGEFKEAYGDKPDDHSVWGFNMVSMTYGHLRAAREALALTSAARE